MKKVIIAAAAAMAATGVSAAVKLPAYIGNNMVLQQNTEITIPGVTNPGAKVTVTPSWGSPVKATADAEGNFTVTLTAPAAGGPFSIIFDDGEAVAVENILSGEVWLCSGQSNMEMPVSGSWARVIDNETEVATAHNPNIRLLQVHKNISTTPLETIDFNGGGWLECTAGTVPEFSACAYFYARELADKLGVPVGVIDSTWGGTSAEAWTPMAYLESVPGFEFEVSDLKEANGDVAKMQELNSARYNNWKAKLAADEKVASKDVYHKGEEGWSVMQLPGNWESKGINLDGIVYFQRNIDIPADWAGKEIVLHFPGIDDEDVTYFNGKEIARGGGWNVERAYKVPADLVKAGEALITIVVTDTGGEGGIYGDASKMYVECDGERKSLTGNWDYMISSNYSKFDPAPITVGSSNYPTVLYNAMINPLRNFPVKGCIWYQGCNNVGRDEQYAVLFPQMVKGWRDAFNNPDMPFYFVQLAGYLAPNYCQPDSKWAALRNSQLAVLNLDNTGVAAAIDLGNPVDIHPRNKQEVARRLSLLARNKTYGQDVACEAPKCIKSNVSGDKMTLTFDGPVHATSAAALGFILGDKAGNWQPATAEISKDGTTIVLTAPGIRKPVAARYDWADYPNGNIYSSDNLPVVPFATDK